MTLQITMVTRDYCVSYWVVRREADGRLSETPTHWLGGETASAPGHQML
jgi:hypothetical protein